MAASKSETGLSGQVFITQLHKEKKGKGGMISPHGPAVQLKTNSESYKYVYIHRPVNYVRKKK